MVDDIYLSNLIENLGITMSSDFTVKASLLKIQKYSKV